ncbi:MAG: hypothetical protein K2Q06_01125, partial [Parvularculaceae bacterium]|nr:hypothetical protein [Parvularculaceae bacterium]
PARIVGASGLGSVAREIGALARTRFAEARGALRHLDWRVLRPALLMMGVYESYLDKLEARGWERIGASVSLSKAAKLAVSARYFFAPPLKAPR